MSREEILANKHFSLPVAVNRDRIRFRDIWDSAWLDRQKVQPNPEFVTGRVMEFGIEDFGERVATMRNMLQDPKTQRRFREEMLRFLPLAVITRVLDRPGYMSHVISTVDGGAFRGSRYCCCLENLERVIMGSGLKAILRI